MAFDAFISYSSKDKAAADAACAVLENAGVRVWIAPRDIRAGGEYGAAIIDAIDQCRVMVLIFSSNANASQQILREIERAVSKGVAVVPVRIEEVTPTRSMAYFLGTIHWLDALTPPIEKHLHQLADTVKAILQADASRSAPRNEPLGAPAPVWDGDHATPRMETPPPFAVASFSAPKTSARTKWLLGAVGAVLGAVVLVGGGAWILSHLQPVAAPPSPPPSAPPPAQQAEVLVPETVPFISDFERASIRSAYLPAADHKALAISTQVSFVTGQKDDETAKRAAMDACKRTSGENARFCALYAVGDIVVYEGARPTLPLEPWIVRDPSIERPLVAKEIPLLAPRWRDQVEKSFPSLGPSKALAIGLNYYAYFGNQANIDEAARRSLEWCSFHAGTACMVLAVDNAFVVPIPTTMKPNGFFRAANNAAIAAELRADVARRLANATNGWNVVAVGASGRTGLGLRAAKEEEGIDRALADCGRQDRNCHVIAIGPFSVEPLPVSTQP